MANELLDSFAAEIASNDAPLVPSADTSADTSDEKLEESSATEETEEETLEAGEEEGETLEEELPARTIAPPNSMNATEVEHFNGLSEEMQDFVVRREQDRDSHLTRGTQQLAEEQRQVETLKVKWNEQLNAQAQTLSQITQADVEPPDPAIRDNDPETYDNQMASYVHNLHAQKQAEKQLVNVQQEQQAERQRQTVTQTVELKRLIPEFNDPEKAGPLQQRIFNYAQGAGYDSNQLSNVTANDVLVLHKAMLYDEITQSGREVAKKAPFKAAPKSAKPGTAKGFQNKRQDKFDKLQKRLNKGDDKAMVGLFEMQLESEGYGTGDRRL